jgi:hypothetical protein
MAGKFKTYHVFFSITDPHEFDSEKANGNGLPNGRNGLNGLNGLNGNGPLPPDGMYHVSDIANGSTNGAMDSTLIHGSLTDKVKTRTATHFIMPSSTCV